MGQTRPSLSAEHTAAARARSWEKPLWIYRGAAARPGHIKAAARARAEAAPRGRCQVRGRGPGSPRPLGSAPAAQWKFPSRLQPELAAGPGGRRGCGGSHSAGRGTKGSGWDKPPPPGPALTAALVGHWVSGGSCYCRLNKNYRQV
uniref:translation initiation factor IF-2-like n=1 Tax=Agelaius phoeniceus TaxID=39638 RepID=UPI0023EBF480|nr:translation initiation factor IF-2-like [Agelaius phoeniceus]